MINKITKSAIISAAFMAVSLVPSLGSAHYDGDGHYCYRHERYDYCFRSYHSCWYPKWWFGCHKHVILY